MIMQAASQGSVTQEHQPGKANDEVYKMKLTITFPFWKNTFLADDFIIAMIWNQQHHI